MRAHVLNILSAAAVCSVSPAYAAAPDVVRDICTEAEAYAATLTRALEALQQVSTREQADAAAAHIEPVHAAAERMRRHCDRLEASAYSIKQLISREPSVKRALLLIPAVQFTRAVQQELADGCHGSTRLFCALNNTRHQYNDAQLEAPLSEADAATLREAEAAFRALHTLTETYSTRPAQLQKHADAFCQAVRAAQPGIPAVRQHPIAAMRLAQLTTRHRTQLERLSMSQFYNNHTLYQLIVTEGNNFISELYTPATLSQHKNRKP